MKITDSHVHFWKYDAIRHGWINDEMALLQKNFLPSDLVQIFNQNKISGCVAVQAEQTEAETNFLLSLGNENEFIEAIVGWTNLLDKEIEQKIIQYQTSSKLKGFRHILQAEPSEYVLQAAFFNGMKCIEKYGYTYDILVYPKQLEAIIKLIETFPGIQFVIDHLAKPYIKKGEMGNWAKAMQKIASYPNVLCKISGMVTEADWNHWTALNLRPYIDQVVEEFGTNRIMFGSDWPVCLLASNYEKWLTTMSHYFESFSITEQENFFSTNCLNFYKIN